jgi:excisionase family DNA binding protein
MCSQIQSTSSYAPIRNETGIRILAPDLSCELRIRRNDGRGILSASSSALSKTGIARPGSAVLAFGGSGVVILQTPWITIDEAAEVSGLPASCIKTLIEAKQLPAIDVGPRPGGRWRVKRTDLEKLEGH